MMRDSFATSAISAFLARAAHAFEHRGRAPALDSQILALQLGERDRLSQGAQLGHSMMLTAQA